MQEVSRRFWSSVPLHNHVRGWSRSHVPSRHYHCKPLDDPQAVACPRFSARRVGQLGRVRRVPARAGETASRVQAELGGPAELRC